MKKTIFIIMIVSMFLVSCSDAKAKEKRMNDLTKQVREIETNMDNGESSLFASLIMPYDPDDQQISSIVHWFENFKENEYAPILIVTQDRTKKEIKSVVVILEDKKLCLVDNSDMYPISEFPESCDIFEDYKIIYQENGDVEIYLSRLKYDKLVMRYVVFRL
ncbi:MAG: hypothetical protein RR565_04920 [Erysipelothrix sp.]